MLTQTPTRPWARCDGRRPRRSRCRRRLTHAATSRTPHRRGDPTRTSAPSQRAARPTRLAPTPLTDPAGPQGLPKRPKPRPVPSPASPQTPRPSRRRVHDPHRQRAPAQRPPPATPATSRDCDPTATASKKPTFENRTLKEASAAAPPTPTSAPCSRKSSNTSIPPAPGITVGERTRHHIPNRQVPPTRSSQNPHSPARDINDPSQHNPPPTTRRRTQPKREPADPLTAPPSHIPATPASPSPHPPDKRSKKPQASVFGRFQRAPNDDLYPAPARDTAKKCATAAMRGRHPAWVGPPTHRASARPAVSASSSPQPTACSPTAN